MKRIFLLLLFLAFFSNVNAQWTQQNPNTNTWLEDIYCTGADTCYAVGVGGIGGPYVIKTTNGGVTWVQKDSGLPAIGFQSIFCTNNNTCFIGNGDAYKTLDGGNSWVIKSNPSISFTAIFFVNDSVGYASNGGGGQIIKTTDAGETWNWSVILGPTGPVYAVYFTDENTGYAIEYYSPDGRIWKTTNGGGNWIQIYLETGNQLTDVVFVNDTTGFVTGVSGIILKTIDAGNTWTPQISGTTNTLNSVHCIDTDTCYAVGSAGTVIKTTNGGNTWVFDTVGVPNNVINAVFFPTPLIGYSVGNGPVIIKTDKSTGINNVDELKPQIYVYPNPVTDKTINLMINSATPDNLSFTIYDFNR